MITPTNASEIRVVVVDDHTLMRQGLVNLLSNFCKFTVVGQASDGLAGVEVVKNVLPHVVLMDISMPGMNGIDATRRLAAEAPEVKVVALTMHHSDEMRREMKSAGAVGYLTKSADASEVCAAIREAAMPSA